MTIDDKAWPEGPIEPTQPINPTDSENSVEHPSHYNQNSGIECIEGIEAALGTKLTIGFCLGNALKYIWRCQYKGHMQEDLEKARWYINKALVLM